ncbi:MAG: peptidoglycan editing factor PgeF [Lachnospiraceae bacterium]|nr:peptidoglycan editing factor PgeF [Lachnospiraceae bacterium]
MNINYLTGRSRTTDLISELGRAPYIAFRPFKDIDYITHGFSTRLGGVSRDIYESMNLSFTRGDNTDIVRKNFDIMGLTLGISPGSMVYADQTHTANVLHVDSSHKGMGITRDRSFSDVDGLITDEPGVCLVTGHADCIPLYFVDTKKHAIGLAHAGWKGTAANIAGVVIKKMTEDFGTDPKDLIAFAGPGICRDHYEVGEDVAERFAGMYGDLKMKHILKRMPDRDGEPKYLLNLHMANYYNMVAAGMENLNAYITDICTFCNPQLLFSHRYTKGLRGGMCAFLMLK